MKLNHPIIKKAGTGVTTLLLYGAVLQTGLFARDEGRLTLRPLVREAAKPENQAPNNAEARGKKMEVIAIQSTRNAKTLILESLDGRIYTVLNSKEQLDGGILRLPTDVLYCEVTLEEENDEGGQVILGAWSNGGPMTEEGKQLQKQLWEKIKAKKKELRHDQWLKFHGDQAAPPKR